MDTNFNSTDKADTSNLKAGEAHVMPSASIVNGGLAGLSFLELLVVGAGAFVVYKNKDMILGYFERSGIDLADIGTKVKSLMNLAGGGKNESSGSEKSSGRSGRGRSNISYS